jgi:cytochrome c
MKRVVMVMVLIGFFLFGVSHFANAATLEEAKSLGQKGAAYITANGKEKGLQELGNPKGQFAKGALYVTVHGYDGTVLAFSPNPKLVRQNHWEVKDATGKYLVREQVEAAKKGGGWVTYSWTNPATKMVGKKKAWVQPVESMNLYTLCGLFE